LTNPDYTAIAVVVDRSGSMITMQKDAEGGLNSFIKEQKKEPGKATLRIDQFDTVYENVIKSTPIKDVKKYFLTPRGGTALLDAIGKTVTDFGAELAALPEDERPGNVIVVVVTDGGENSSKEWTAEGVKALISKQESEFSWNFIFLAANQDAITVGAQYGFSSGTSMTYDAASVGSTYSTLSANVSRSRATGILDSFTDEQRQQSVSR
jgi:uncharacterized protein YegL